jgi:biopolymer transport protein ExbB
MTQAITDIQHLLEVGGGVLITIFLVAIALWTLIIERFWYMRLVHPRKADEIARAWDAIVDKECWDAHAIRRLWISQLTMDLDRGLAMIRALVSVCPLLGLLGTTTGMVEVYEVMSIEGQGEPRLMAAGVSQAMITTMAGLVIALSGIFFSVRLEGHLVAEHDRIAARLHIDEDLLGHHHRVRSDKAKARAMEANERRRESSPGESESTAVRAAGR